MAWLLLLIQVQEEVMSDAKGARYPAIPFALRAANKKQALRFVALFL
jgi:hypothetical protein